MRKSVLVLGCLVVLGGAVAVLAFTAVGQYNRLVNLQEDVTSQWGQVEGAYQRRADLVPNLVATVKGAAKFEQDTLTQVVEARSKVGQATVGAGAVNDPAAMQRFAAAQDALSSALSRLLVVVERYPELKAVAAFRDLQAQLEGTENRINVERKRYNDLARDFNAARRRVPASWLIGMLGWDFPAKAYFQAQAGAQNAPKVEF
jgi:LemA protein